jgi:hypothetical protein
MHGFEFIKVSFAILSFIGKALEREDNEDVIFLYFIVNMRTKRVYKRLWHDVISFVSSSVLNFMWVKLQVLSAGIQFSLKIMYVNPRSKIR